MSFDNLYSESYAGNIWDEELPSYQSASYRYLKSKLEFVADMYIGRESWVSVDHYLGYSVKDPVKAERYLPPENGEDDKEYLKRLARSYFDPKFKTSIDTFAGFLSSFIFTEDTHPTILESQENIDAPPGCKGNSLEVFLESADRKALRDGHCFILVEFPKRPPEIQDALTERRYGLHPYLVLIDARDLINWKFASDNKTLVQATIREQIHVDKGRYGTECRTRYRVLTPGYYELFDVSGEGVTLLEAGEVSLPQIPLVPYVLLYDDCRALDPFTNAPPFFNLAEMQLKLYQKSSEKDEAMHKTNLALLQIEEIVPEARSENDPQPVVSIGPNTCLWNVRASFVEPSGSALNATQADIERLETRIDGFTLSFLSGSSLQRTATEVVAASTPLQSNISSMAEAKQSAVETCFDFWAQYMNSPKGGGIVVDKKVLELSMPADKIGVLLQMRGQSEITRKTFLKLLVQGKVLPKDFDVETEVADASKEVADRMAAMIPPATSAN